MKKGQSFSDERVRHLKTLMIRGADPVALARLEGVSANTLWRMKKGETYNHVRVEGEDSMRAPINLPDYDPTHRGEVNDRALSIPLPANNPDWDADAMLARIMAGKPSPVEGIPDDIAEQARRYGAKF